jgi:glycine betaine/choline ABC-type transport system substrate-binding protein
LSNQKYKNQGSSGPQEDALWSKAVAVHCSYVGTRLFNLTKHIEAIHDKAKEEKKVKKITDFFMK